jgi:alpha-galactosidase
MRTNVRITSRFLLLAAALGAVLTSGVAAGSASVSPEEMKDRDAVWLAPFNAAQMPYSFTFDGKPSSEWIKAVSEASANGGEEKKLDDVRTQYTRTWTDAKTGLEVRCVTVVYSDFPVIESTLYFKNTGKADTPMLKDIKALDVGVGAEDGKAVLHYNRGTIVKADDFQPLTAELAVGKPLVLTPNGGRSSGGIWPYFNLQCGDRGQIIVVGWPGKWAASFELQADKTVRVTAGQELVNTKLLPGEEIRTPLVVQMFYRGDVTRAQNIFRRWMLAHNVPRPGGKLPPPQLNACSSHQFAEMTLANEANQKQFVDRYVEEGIKLTYWWMDAGWYPCGGQWFNTGTWEVDKTRFPNGLRAISDHARQKGIKTIVWFEPERLVANSWLHKEHKDWVLGDQLLNLGNPQALAWAIEHFNKIIDEQGIDLYRQDYNIDPLPLWRNNDAKDRQGITENKYVVGYLAYWDGLRAKHPNMLIDSCAGGGHRNDLETMRRSVPLLRSDYIFEPIGQQGHTYGLAQWLPFFGTGAITIDPYIYRSCMCAGNTLAFDMRKKDLNYALARKLTEEWRTVAPCYLGDYYPLTPYSLDKNAWMAFQFDRPESGDGMVQAFRRDDCGDAARTFKLQGLDAEATYEVTDLDVGTPVSISGKKLMDEGLAVEIKGKPGAAIIRYKRGK